MILLLIYYCTNVTNNLGITYKTKKVNIKNRTINTYYVGKT